MEVDETYIGGKARNMHAKVRRRRNVKDIGAKKSMVMGAIERGDRGINPAAAAKLADDHGFNTFYVPEHTHIPIKREAAHPTTGDESLPDDRYMRTLDPGCRLGAACRGDVAGAAVDGGRTARRARPDHAGQVDRHPRPPLRGPGQPWRRIRLEHRRTRRPQRPPGRRRTMLREYIEAMRALWTRRKPNTTASSSSSGRQWAWPKPVQSHIPVLVGAAGTEKNFKWIARSADGWITTPRDFDIDEPVKLLQDTWAAAGRDGAPQIVALDFKPDPEKLAHWQELGVTEVLFGLPDKSEDEVAGYVERLAGKLAALV